MEMSRQRLRTGVLEATTRGCPHCDGSGLVRTAASAGLSALRLIEDEAAKGRGIVITLFASQEASIYLLNAKRNDLAEIEARYGVAVEVIPEGENEGAKMRVASSGPRNEFVPKFEQILIEEDDYLPEEDDEDEGEEFLAETAEPREPRDDDTESDGNGGRRKRRKRRRGRSRDRVDGQGNAETNGENGEAEGEYADGEGEAEAAADDAEPSEGEAGAETDDGTDGEGPRKRRRRRRPRGGEGSQAGGSEG